VNSEPASNLTEAQSAPLDPIDRFWIEISHELAKESVASIEGAAKQVIGITSALQAVYFAVISFADLRRALGSGWMTRWFLVEFLLPPIVWTLSLALAASCFSPKSYRTNLRSPDLAEKFYRDITHYKHRQLVRSYYALVVGFILVLANAIGFLQFGPVK